jgi:UDP-N-acetylglucosamine 4,6-dehydratase
MRQHLGNNPLLRFFIGDVRDKDRLLRAMHEVDVVVHAAALKRVEVGEYDSGEIAKTNVGGTQFVIEAAQETGVRKCVLISSDKACEPRNCYGASKLMAEKLFLSANNSRGQTGPIFSVVRYGNVAGSTGSVIPTWSREHEQGRPVRLTHPDATRFWMTRKEAVGLVMRTIDTMKGGELVIPELPAYRLADLATAMGVEYNVHGLNPGEKMHESMKHGETSNDARRMTISEIREQLKVIYA